MDSSPDEIRTAIIYQVGALRAFCDALGTKLAHVKPHGALYLTAVEEESVARGVAEAIVSVDPNLKYVALAGAKGELMRRIGEEMGLQVVYEAFPDRAYTAEGTLVSRRQPGAMIHDPKEVAERVVRMAKEGKVLAIDGTEIELQMDTLCVHGDNPTAVELVKAIREGLEAEGVELRSMAELS
jgi:UPF0271 protein